MRVIHRLFVGVGLQATAQVVKSLKTLVDHHPLAKQVKRQQIHRHVGLLHQPVVNVPVGIYAHHGIGKLSHLVGQVLNGDTTFLLVFVLVCHASSSDLTAYEASPDVPCRTGNSLEISCSSPFAETVVFPTR